MKALLQAKSKYYLWQKTSTPSSQSSPESLGLDVGGQGKYLKQFFEFQERFFLCVSDSIRCPEHIKWERQQDLHMGNSLCLAWGHLNFLSAYAETGKEVLILPSPLLYPVNSYISTGGRWLSAESWFTVKWDTLYFISRWVYTSPRGLSVRAMWTPVSE